MKLKRPGAPVDVTNLPLEELQVRQSKNRTPVRIEASGWGMMNAIHNAFVNPLLIDRGAGPIALGIFNSGANFFLYSSGFVGPRLAYKAGGLGRAVMGTLFIARFLLILLTAFLWAVPDGAVVPLLVLILLWTAGEGLAVPLWTAFIAGLVPASQRGRWLAMRGTAASAASAGIMIALLILMQFQSKSGAVPFAYTLAAISGLVSLWQLRYLFSANSQPIAKEPQSLRKIPEGRENRRFLGGVFVFWFGAGIVWPILPPYIINDLGAPTAYFAVTAAVAAVSAALVQRRWGRYGDHQGARAMIYFSGFGAAVVPFAWCVAPVYQFGPLIELVASASWPGHTMGLTMRAVELSKTEEDRPTMLAWSALAQGAGACISPLVASVLVHWTGTIPLLLASGVLRIVGSIIISDAEREKWFAGRAPFRLPGRHSVRLSRS